MDARFRRLAALLINQRWRNFRCTEWLLTLVGLALLLLPLLNEAIYWFSPASLPAQELSATQTSSATAFPTDTQTPDPTSLPPTATASVVEATPTTTIAPDLNATTATASSSPTPETITPTSSATATLVAAATSSATALPPTPVPGEQPLRLALSSSASSADAGEAVLVSLQISSSSDTSQRIQASVYLDPLFEPISIPATCSGSLQIVCQVQAGRNAPVQLSLQVRVRADAPPGTVGSLQAGAIDEQANTAASDLVYVTVSAAIPTPTVSPTALSPLNSEPQATAPPEPTLVLAPEPTWTVEATIEPSLEFSPTLSATPIANFVLPTATALAVQAATIAPVLPTSIATQAAIATQPGSAQASIGSPHATLFSSNKGISRLIAVPAELRQVGWLATPHFSATPVSTRTAGPTQYSPTLTSISAETMQSGAAAPAQRVPALPVFGLSLILVSALIHRLRNVLA